MLRTFQHVLAPPRPEWVGMTRVDAGASEQTVGQQSRWSPAWQEFLTQEEPDAWIERP